MTDHQPLTDEELAAMKARAEAASDGPWEPWAGQGWPKWWAEHLGLPEDEGGMGWGLAGPKEMAHIDGYPGSFLIMARRSEDQAFIAASRKYVPRLIAEVERLKAKVERLLAEREVSSE